MYQKLLLAFILLLSTAFTAPSCLNMDIILIGDLSGSVRGHEKFVGSAIYSFVDKLDIDENLQLGLLVFNDNSTTVRALSSDKDSLKSGALVVGKLTALGSTFLVNPLQAALGEFIANGNSKHKKMIILITDGIIDDLYETDLLIAKYKQLGIQFCGVMVRDGYSNPSFFKATCDECYVESSYENLIEQLKRLDICL